MEKSKKKGNLKWVLIIGCLVTPLILLILGILVAGLLAAIDPKAQMEKSREMREEKGPPTNIEYDQ